MNIKFKWFVIGWFSILVLKYVIVGLDAWNNTFHPGLIIAPNQQAYRRPFLGWFG